MCPCGQGLPVKLNIAPRALASGRLHGIASHSGGISVVTASAVMLRFPIKSKLRTNRIEGVPVSRITAVHALDQWKIPPEH
jgi:hypothetical protein